MKAAFEFLERLFRQISGTFLFRAVLPWTLAVLIDLGVYEYFTRYSWNMANLFLPLLDHSALALPGLAGLIYAAALASDEIANDRIRKHIEDHAWRANPPSDLHLPFEIASWWTETKLRHPLDSDRLEPVLAKIDEVRAATLRKSNLMAALFVSTWPVAAGVAAYPSDRGANLVVAFALTWLTVGSFNATRRYLDDLIALDGIRRKLRNDLLKSETEALPERRPEREMAQVPWLETAVLCLPLLLALTLLVLTQIQLIRTTEKPQREEEEKAETDHLTIIAVNDIYRLDGVSNGERGGLARLRTLRTSIEREGRKVVLLHAGDFLSPSLVSGIFKGKSMIDVMNRLDGDKDRFDDNMFVVFGNHEFDDSKCRDGGAVLDDRVARSQFTWLNANLDFSDCYMQSSIPDLRNVRQNVILAVGKAKIGLFGIGLTPDKMENMTTSDYPRYEDEMNIAVANIDDLRGRGANLVIAITHLPHESDQRLLDELGGKGLDLILGGHDHDCMTLDARGGFAYGFKADSDAKTAWRIDLDIPSSGQASMDAKLVTLDDRSVLPDPDVARRSKQLTDWAEAVFCRKTRGSGNPRCLDERIGRTRASIDLDESTNRSKETGFGDWLADLVLDKTHADIAIVNSGALGLNENLAPNSELRLRQLAAIFRYDNVVATRLFSAKKICEALKYGFSTPGKGAWPHISGIKVKITGGSGTGNTVDVDRPDCDNDDGEIEVAGFPFLLCGNDGYRSFAPVGETNDECLNRLTRAGRENGLISSIAEEAIRHAGDAGINPELKRRVDLSGGQVVTPPACIRERKNALFRQYR